MAEVAVILKPCLIALYAVVFCGDPGVPANGFRNVTSTEFGSTVGYSCVLGYELQGSNARTCQADGLWSGSVPTCQLASCPDPGIPPNSQRQLFDLTVGSYIIYSCLPGYRLDGVASILCLTSQEWTSLPPQCVCELMLNATHLYIYKEKSGRILSAFFLGAWEWTATKLAQYCDAMP